MEKQISNIFLSIWNQQKKQALGSGPPRIPEQGEGILLWWLSWFCYGDGIVLWWRHYVEVIAPKIGLRRKWLREIPVCQLTARMRFHHPGMSHRHWKRWFKPTLYISWTWKVKFLDQVQWAFSRTFGKSERCHYYWRFSRRTVGFWAGFSQVLRMRNKYHNCLEMNQTGGNAIRLVLTNLQPALNKLADKHHRKVRIGWSSCCLEMKTFIKQMSLHSFCFSFAYVLAKLPVYTPFALHCF